MLTDPVQVLGLTRWSYPFQSKDFRTSGKDLADLRAQLYAPARLDHRLFLLEHVMLPSLRKQRDQNFTHLFLMEDQLPEPWRSRVLALLNTVPQIIPVFEPEGGDHSELCRDVIKRFIDPDCETTAQYRLDDDDAVGRDFVAKARSMFAPLKQFRNEAGRIALDFTRGFILRSDTEGMTMKPVSMRFWAPGMVLYLPPESRRALLDVHHLRVWHDMPVLTSQDEPMFIRGVHHSNDSDIENVGRRTRSFKFNHRNPRRFYLNRFGLDLEAVSYIWNLRKSHFMALDNGPVQLDVARKQA